MNSKRMMMTALISAALALPAVAQPAQADATAKIQQSVTKDIHAKKYNNVGASVDGSTVTLTGSVAKLNEKLALEKKVRKIHGVTQVNDQVEVASAASDDELTRKVAKKLAYDRVGYGNLFEPHVTYHRADAAGELTVDRPLEVKALTMMHDFAMTSGHVIFLDLPIVFNVGIAQEGKGDMPYRWDDDYGARLGVLRRDDPFGEVRWFEIDPCYVFHVANAYDAADGTVVMDVVAYATMFAESKQGPDAAGHFER